MSSTHKAKDDSVFHQSRYASSPEFERGLSGYLVAKRTTMLDGAADRELVWFLQYLSHQSGGLEAIAKELVAKYSERIQTAAMIQQSIKPGDICRAEQVRAIRGNFPDHKFFLKGENDVVDVILSRNGIQDEEWSDFGRAERIRREHFDDLMSDESNLEKKAASYPTSYPANTFFNLCREAATSNLLNHLRELCLNPDITMKSGPWYFPGLITTLQEYQAGHIKSKSDGLVTTALGRKVCEVLDYTLFSRALTLIEGEARRGKSFAARKWCEQHPGQARFIEVPTGNDEVSFFRELARGLGIGNFLQYKVTEIRARVEAVVRTGNILIVLDEAHRLWPHRNLRYAYPTRISWVMSMAGHDVPICCISTPQFIQMQKVVESRGNWCGAQLTGRNSHYEFLPVELSVEDLQAVAQSVLPEAAPQVLRALAAYARTSDRYLAAIDSISKRARYIAARAGRAEITSDDVRIAMKESVIPSDTRLHTALESGRKAKPGRMAYQPIVEPVLPAPVMTAKRAGQAEDLGTTRRRGQTQAAPFQRVRDASLIEA